VSHCSTRSALIALIAMPVYAMGAETADPSSGTQVFSFSGFGTLGVVHSSENKADFTSSVFKPGGAGYTESWSAAVDSLIGAQLTADITTQLSAVVQIIAEQNDDNTYKPHVEWANVKYQFTPDFSLRVGRVLLPTFFASDLRKVGYANPWVRPPSEVYALLPITNGDGVDISYRLHIGDLTDTVQANLGQNDAELPYHRGNAHGRNQWGLANTAEYGAWTLHIAFQKSQLTIASFDALFNAFRLFGPQGIAIADKYNLDNKPFVTEAIGARYDPGRWFMMGEWAHSNTHSIFSVDTAWYVSAGYRLWKFTPYVTYAVARTDTSSDPGLSLSGLPPNLAGFAAGLNAGLNAILESNPDQSTVSVGSRWDFMKNLDLKLQYDHSRHGARSAGNLTNLQPGFQPGGTVNLFSATVDFVF
jgi:predicted porin